MTDDIQHEVGSGNVFADLGFANPEEHLAKAGLALAISKRIKALGLTQAQVAKLTGEDQARISAITRGHFREISLERLSRHLQALGMDIELTITEAPPDRRQGAFIVKAS